MVPEFSDICVPDCIPTHTEIPVHEVEKYRYRYTGFEFGPVPITKITPLFKKKDFVSSLHRTSCGLVPYSEFE
jgi:hypothetical protein